jgi:hypothetical protein
VWSKNLNVAEGTTLQDLYGSLEPKKLGKETSSDFNGSREPKKLGKKTSPST